MYSFLVNVDRNVDKVGNVFGGVSTRNGTHHNDASFIMVVRPGIKIVKIINQQTYSSGPRHFYVFVELMIF